MHRSTFGIAGLALALATAPASAQVPTATPDARAVMSSSRAPGSSRSTNDPVARHAASASLASQDRPRGFGIHCGGFGRPAVEIVVADSSAARGGTITIANGENPEFGDNGHAVEVWRGEHLMRCVTSIGTTEVRAPVTDGVRLSIEASRPVPVAVRSAGGRELARTTFQPGSPDVELTWGAER